MNADSVQDDDPKSASVQFEGFANKARLFGAPDDICKKLPVEWPDDIAQSLNDAGFPAGSDLAQIEHDLEKSRPKPLWRAIKRLAIDNALKWVLAGVATVCVTLVKYPIPFAESDVSHWHTEVVPFTLPESLETLPISFTSGQCKFKEAVFIRKHVENSGRTEIKSDDNGQSFRLEAKEGTYFMEVSEVSSHPYELKTRVDWQQPASKTITINVESFEPRDVIDLSFLLVGTSDESTLQLKLDPPSRVRVGVGSPNDRLFNAYEKWVKGIFGGLVFFFSIKSVVAYVRFQWKRNKVNAIYEGFQTLAGLVVLALLGGTALTYVVTLAVRFVWL